MKTQQARRILFGVVATIMLVLGAAPIQVGSAASNRDALAIAALDAIPAEDWLKHSSGALLDRVIAASSKESLDAAAAEDPRAQALVGSAYLSGLHGYTKNETEAVKLYRLAANSNPIAQNNLGNLLLSGVANGGAPAPTDAAEMFLRAAKQGHPVAQLNLGRLYADGVGVQQDVAKAKEFLTLAAAQGNSDAAVDLSLLEKREAAEEWKRLEAAAATGEADALKVLAEAYAAVDKNILDLIKTNQLQAAVNALVRAPDPKRLRYLELTDEHGMTALHWAVRHRNAAGMRWLLDKSAALELKDNYGRTPLKVALENVDTRAMSILIDRGANASTALPGHDMELKELKKTEEIVDFMIWTAAPAAAAALYQKACSTEEPITCRKLGLRYNKGDGVPKDPAKAAALFTIACDANDAEACHGLSWLFDRGEGVPKDSARAVALVQKACAGNHAAACTGVGFRYLFGDGLPMDQRKAAEHFEKACNGNDGWGCDVLGLMHETNEGGAMDPAKAAALYAKACKLGYKESCDRKTAKAAVATTPAKPSASELDASCQAKDWNACHELAFRYDRGDGVTADGVKVVSYHTKACDGGIPESCTHLGYRYRNGKGVTKDLTKAVALYQKACSAKEATACLNLGLLYHQGEGVPKDLAKAAPLYRTACDADVATVEACHWLAGLHMKGEGVPKDTAKAVALYQKACDGKYVGACIALAGYYYQGTELPKDLRKAAALIERACDGDAAKACHLLSLIYRDGDGVAPDQPKAAMLLAKACKLGEQKACTEQTAAAPTNATSAAAKPANAACKIVKVQPGVDTVASVERDIRARGGSPSTGGSGLSKYRMSALSGDYADAGSDVMAVSYDFDAAGPAGRLVAVTIVNHANNGPGYEKLLASRKAAAAAIVGPLQQKSATEFVASAPGCQLRFLPNADTLFIHEVYQLPN